jgi:hypothetical protein
MNMEGKKFRFSGLFLGVFGGAVCLLLAVSSWGLQTAEWWQYKGFSKNAPILKLTPQQLPSVPINPAQGMTLSHAGFAFEVPWADLDGQNSKVVKNIAKFSFKSGRVIEFFGPGPNQEDLLSTAEKSLGDKDGSLKKVFGEQATKSHYNFQKTVLEQTPDELKPWMNEGKAFRLSMLLMLKGSSSVGGGTGLFHAGKQGWKGFQFDDPSKKPNRVTLELYDSKDQHVVIIFLPGKGEGAGITQSDVNRVLQTLAPAMANGDGTVGGASLRARE